MSSGSQCLNWSEIHLTFCHISPDSEFFTTSAAIAGQIFVISLLIVSCVFFNSLMLYAVYKTSLSSSLKLSTSSILLTNLAVVDVLVGVLILPFWITSTATLGWTLPHKVCELTAFVTTTLMQCSIFFLSGIAIDLYGCIRHPLRYPVLATNSRVGLVVLGIWMLGIIVASLPLYGWGKYSFQPQTIPICNPLYLDSISYTIFLILVGMALPFSVMMFSYIKIVQIARNHIRRIDDAHIQLAHTFHQQLITVDNRTSVDTSMKAHYRLSHAHDRHHAKSKFARNLKTVRRVFIAVLAFFVCWGPYVILNFWSVNHEDTAVPYSADLFTTLMAFANSTVNPVIFILLNKDYRRVVRRLVARIASRCRNNAVISLREESDISYVGDRTDINYNGKCFNNVSRIRNSCCQNGDVNNSAVPKTEDSTDGNSNTIMSDADGKKNEDINGNGDCLRSTASIRQHDNSCGQNGVGVPSLDTMKFPTDIYLNLGNSPGRSKKGICQNGVSISNKNIHAKDNSNINFSGRKYPFTAGKVKVKSGVNRNGDCASFSAISKHSKPEYTAIYTVSDKVQSTRDTHTNNFEEKSKCLFLRSKPKQSKEQLDSHPNSKVLGKCNKDTKLFDKRSNLKHSNNYLQKEKDRHLSTKAHTRLPKPQKVKSNTELYVADVESENSSDSDSNNDVTSTRTMKNPDRVHKRHLNESNTSNEIKLTLPGSPM